MKIGTAFHSKILLHFHSPPSTPPRKYSPLSFHQPIFSFHHTNLNLRAGRRNLVLRSQNLDFKVEEELMDLKKDSLELNRNLYPAIEPYSTGFLKVSDLHSIYWEQSGNPSGHPVVFFHGGPGGGTSPSNRRFFDPEFYRIILFDQRGAGKSTPHACLEENTTWDLVADIEKLREHLEIPEWQVFGGSWGSTLALAYSQSHPEKVTGLVLRGIFLLRKKEIDWFYEGGAAAIFPDAWEPFRDLIPENERSCLVEAYHKRLNSDDPETQNAAAKAWTKWEMMTAHLLPNEENVKRGDDDSFSLAFARIENHSTQARSVTDQLGPNWERRVRASALPRSKSGFSVLVTGAAGFVGSHVSLALKRRGDGVLGLDNFNNYYEVGLKRARKSLLARSGVYIIEGDINDAVLLQKLLDAVAFTHVMHLAAQAGVRYAMQNPSSYIHSNIAGFVNLLEACKSSNPQPAIVWASSSSVYGLNSQTPFSEKDRTDQPASLYAATKKAGEEIAHTYNHIYGLSITGLRFFTVYGPWGRPDMAYFTFTKDILRGKEIKIFETSDHHSVARDFTYIDDVVKGCLGALDTAKKSTGSGGKKKGAAQLRIYNLGNTKPVPVGKLVSTLEKLLKMKAKKKVLVMPRNGDVPFTHANITLARGELGYKPTTDLETGLKKFVKWYLNYYGSKKRSAW